MVVHKAADEALDTGHANRGLPHIEHGRRLVEHLDPRLGQNRRQLVAPVSVPVVVAENRDDGDLHPYAPTSSPYTREGPGTSASTPIEDGW